MARREKCDGCGQQLGWDDDGVCWTCTKEERNESAFDRVQTENMRCADCKAQRFGVSPDLITCLACGSMKQEVSDHAGLRGGDAP